MMLPFNKYQGNTHQVLLRTSRGPVLYLIILEDEFRHYFSELFVEVAQVSRTFFERKESRQHLVDCNALEGGRRRRASQAQDMSGQKREHAQRLQSSR